MNEFPASTSQILPVSLEDRVHEKAYNATFTLSCTTHDC